MLLGFMLASGCANEPAPDEDATVESAESTPAPQLPTCTHPEVPPCLDSCQPFDDAEKEYAKNPIDGKLASLTSTKRSTITTSYEQQPVFSAGYEEVLGVGTKLLQAGAELGGEVCKVLPVFAEFANAGKAIYHVLNTFVFAQHQCFCIQRTGLTKTKWKAPANTAPCMRTRQCWDPGHRAITTEDYASTAQYHGPVSTVADGIRYDDSLAGSCTATGGLEEIGTDVYYLVGRCGNAIVRIPGGYSNASAAYCGSSPGVHVSEDDCVRREACERYCDSLSSK
jgi:hypothetical protein